MSEVLIRVRFTDTKDYGVRRERIAYRDFANGILDLSENADIIGAADENEESEIRMTIRALVEQRSRIPHGKAFAYEERWTEMELQIKKVLKDEYFVEHPSPAHDTQIFEWLRERHPELASSYKTVERRLRSIRAKGGLETDGNGNYSLKAQERLKREITA